MNRTILFVVKQLAKRYPEMHPYTLALKVQVATGKEISARQVITALKEISQ
jgi:hypothetical protein